MAPLSEAINTKYGWTTYTEKHVYHGEIDKEWCVGEVPHGGYLLCLILDAAVQVQSKTAHKDPAHLAATYLRATSQEPYQIIVQTIKTGKGFTNLSLELRQKNVLRIQASAIFSDLPEYPPKYSNPSPKSLTLIPPHPQARLAPFINPPSSLKHNPVYPKFRFKNRIKWAEDSAFKDRNMREGKLEWGAFMELVNPKEKITTAMLPFFCDIFRNTAELLPEGQKSSEASWYPTMHLTLQFMFKTPTQGFAPSTVGLYSTGGFLIDGRHDVSVEIWTSPSEIGGANEGKDWRSKSNCLAKSNQMALTLGLNVNLRQNKPKAKL